MTKLVARQPMKYCSSKNKESTYINYNNDNAMPGISISLSLSSKNSSKIEMLLVFFILYKGSSAI